MERNMCDVKKNTWGYDARDILPSTWIHDEL